MDEQTHHEIAEGLKNGCREAWLRLYDAYAQRVWRDVARLTGADAACVADIVQETFLGAARSARSYDPRRGSLWLWLWGIARRRVAQHYRKQGRFEAFVRAQQWWASLNGQRGDWLAAEADAPPEILASRELATLVRGALAELPAEYQTLLAAKYMEGASVECIVAETGSSSFAVRSKLARARRAFRKVFTKIARPTGDAQEARR
jgi:RNA polymerase sigma-70 factor (ECF subfamily)